MTVIYTTSNRKLFEEILYKVSELCFEKTSRSWLLAKDWTL